MILKDGYCRQLHLIWLGWRPWLVTIHMEPADGWWVAWTWRRKYIVFGDSSEEALENIKKAIVGRREKNDERDKV